MFPQFEPLGCFMCYEKRYGNRSEAMLVSQCSLGRNDAQKDGKEN